MKGEKIFNVVLYIVIILFFSIGGLTFGYTFYRNYKYDSRNISYTTASSSDMAGIDQNDFVGICSDYTFTSSVGIYVVKLGSLGKDIYGKFIKEPYGTIALVSTTTNIIAHEVSHLVDQILLQKGIRDGETRAYLQGYFTQCIEDRVKPRKYYISDLIFSTTTEEQ